MTQDLSHSLFKPRRALLSVSDKSHLIPLAKALQAKNVELIATGNTSILLKEHHILVTDVSEYTGFPELLDGRVKTLHPAIHAGLLARRPEDDAVLEQYALKPIDLVIVNLYPFEQTVSHYDCDFSKAIEHIDIGGPTMIRAAAKNHAHVYVIVTPTDYTQLIDYLNLEKVPDDWRLCLAKKAFAHTAAYDAAISNYLSTLDSKHVPQSFPENLTCQFHKINDLRYGENPHQEAVFYADKNIAVGSLASAQLIQGKQLSYNNILDADAALDCIKSFSQDKPTCVIVKHTTPCGIAYGETLLNAYLNAFQSDPLSAYGGIIALNQTLDAPTATAIIEQQFVEVILAPEITAEARTILAVKTNIRVLITNHWAASPEFRLDMKKIEGGLLVQAHDSLSLTHYELRAVTNKQATEQQLEDLIFACHSVKHVKSNAIVYVKNGATIGIGGGQTSRIMSARIGLWQAEQMGFSTHGAVMASDAFIPFQDTVELATQAGISAIIQPGGSIRDEQIIDCANKSGLVMIFTAMRHFKH
jgi:phosphoribosylaminoimidazolecarboxamide formyltransferase / IMP cyclohydrolase